MEDLPSRAEKVREWALQHKDKSTGVIAADFIFYKASSICKLCIVAFPTCSRSTTSTVGKGAQFQK